ncbi:hypothetical protein H8356DRAFT_928779 [Neocallimastix lanati (nom. inval.)]|nr:hypothetical protein H8356DRAFT_928779 [Neocallimastix sp. JGI-2020a]
MNNPECNNNSNIHSNNDLNENENKSVTSINKSYSSLNSYYDDNDIYKTPSLNRINKISPMYSSFITISNASKKSSLSERSFSNRSFSLERLNNSKNSNEGSKTKIKSISNLVNKKEGNNETFSKKNKYKLYPSISKVFKNAGIKKSKIPLLKVYNKDLDKVDIISNTSSCSLSNHSNSSKKIPTKTVEQTEIPIKSSTSKKSLINNKKSNSFKSSTNEINKDNIELSSFGSVVDLNDYTINNKNFESILKKSNNDINSNENIKALNRSSSQGNVPINYYKINNIEAFINNLRKPILKSNNKYSYKESKTYYCRVVGETVMIRIGGGWKDLNSFIYDRVSKILEYQNDIGIQNDEILKHKQEKNETTKEEEPIYLPINGVKNTLKYKENVNDEKNSKNNNNNNNNNNFKNNGNIKNNLKSKNLKGKDSNFSYNEKDKKQHIKNQNNKTNANINTNNNKLVPISVERKTLIRNG